jgi:hypothetical protein
VDKEPPALLSPTKAEALPTAAISASRVFIVLVVASLVEAGDVMRVDGREKVSIFVREQDSTSSLASVRRMCFMTAADRGYTCQRRRYESSHAASYGKKTGSCTRQANGRDDVTQSVCIDGVYRPSCEVRRAMDGESWCNP